MNWIPLPVTLHVNGIKGIWDVSSNDIRANPRDVLETGCFKGHFEEYANKIEGRYNDIW